MPRSPSLGSLRKMKALSIFLANLMEEWMMRFNSGMIGFCRLSSGFCAGGPPVSEYVVQVKSVDKTQQVRRPQLQTLTPVLLAVGLWTSKAQVQEISIASSPAWISGLFGNSCYRHLLARRPDPVEGEGWRLVPSNSGVGRWLKIWLRQACRILYV